MNSPLNEAARLQSEVAGLRSELGVSERLRIAMFSNLAQKGGHNYAIYLRQHIHALLLCIIVLICYIGGKRGQEGQTAAVSMLVLGYGAKTPCHSISWGLLVGWRIIVSTQPTQVTQPSLLTYPCRMST